MKTIIIILTLLTNFFFQQAINEKELVGSWTVTKAFNEANKACDKASTVVKGFKLKFSSLDNYEMENNYGSITKTNGKYSVDKKNKILKLTYKVGKSNHDLSIPIIGQTKDLLILKYNLCGATDTTSIISGRLELKKVQ